MKFKNYVIGLILLIGIGSGLTIKYYDWKNKNSQITEFLEKGDSYYDLGKISLARTEYYKAINIDSEVKHLFSKNGNEKLFLKDYQGAVKEFSKSIYCLKSTSDFDFLQRGQAYLFTNNIKKACSDFEEAQILGNEEAGNLVNQLCLDEVKIGSLVIMNENLNVDKFRNGDLILEAETDLKWKTASDKGNAAWCYYNNDSENGGKYGKLYNWHAVNDPRGLAPVGWHIPSNAEWTDITSRYVQKSRYGFYFGESGLLIVPGGFRFAGNSFTVFEDLGKNGYWWSSTEYGSDNSWGCDYSHFEDPNFIIDQENNGGIYPKGSGFSVRCVRD